jgi:hypothetical protein
VDLLIETFAAVAAARAELVQEDRVAVTTKALRHWLALGKGEKQQSVQLFRERFDFSPVARNLQPVLQSAINPQRASAAL